MKKSLAAAGLSALVAWAIVSIAYGSDVPTKEPSATPHPGIRLTDEERQRIAYAEQRIKEKQAAKIEADYELDAAMLYLQMANQAVVSGHKGINPKENYVIDADGYAVKVTLSPTPTATPKPKKA